MGDSKQSEDDDSSSPNEVASQVASYLREKMHAPTPTVYSATLASREATRMFYMAGYLQSQKQQTTSGFIRTSVRPPIEHGVAPAAMEVLTKISLSQIAHKVNYIHENRVVFLTTVHDAYKIIGTSTLAEDTEGDYIVISLYNFTQNDDDPTEQLPVGTRLALLAPYMKNAEHPSKPLILRCDNPQCVVRYETKEAWVAAMNGRPPPPETCDPKTLRTKGNIAFRKGKHELALRLYTRAINSCPNIEVDDLVACLSNRAEVFLRREQWEMAEQDARRVLEIDKAHIKARFRLARAMARLGKASQAVEKIKSLCKTQETTDPAFEKHLIEYERVSREEQGFYDLDSMRKEAAMESLAFHGDYVSSQIQIGVSVTSPSGAIYRGCKTKEKIGEGTLLTASKAFAFSSSKMNKASQAYEIHASSKRVNKLSQIEILTEIVAKLQRRPEMGKCLYGLWSGVTASGDQEKIDIPRLRLIIGANTFGVEEQGQTVRTHWMEEKECRRLGRSLTSDETMKTHALLVHTSGSGLWVKESMFNHSCVPNCTWTQIGDHMFIRTCRPVAADEELTTSYLGSEMPYNECVEKFRDWIAPGVGFECWCARCSAMRSSDTLRSLEAEAYSAYSQAADLASKEGIKKGIAAEIAMPSTRRNEVLSNYSRFPLHIQHLSAAKVLLLHGAVLNHSNKSTEALNTFQKAADIGYAVRGTAGFHRLVDLWCIAGLFMRNNQRSRAKENLRGVWTAQEFQEIIPLEEAREAFVDLTLKFSAPWWIDPPGHRELLAMSSLAKEVCSAVSRVEKAPQCKKGKKQRRKKSLK